MLRRWLSIVFWLRKSVSAISRLVRRSQTSSAIARSRSVSALSPVAVALAAGGVTARRAEAVELVARGLGEAPRAARVEGLGRGAQR